MDHLRVAAGEPDPPAGHVVALRERRELDRDVAGAGDLEDRGRLVAVEGDVFLDVLGVDDAAVFQRDALLLAVEVGVVETRDGVFVNDRLLVKQAGDEAALEQVLRDDLFDVAGLGDSCDLRYNSLTDC